MKRDTGQESEGKAMHRIYAGEAAGVERCNPCRIRLTLSGKMQCVVDRAAAYCSWKKF